MIKAVKIVVRLFVKKGTAGSGFDAIYAEMNDDELAAALAIEGAEDVLAQKYGSRFTSLMDFGYYLHPVISDGANAAFVNAQANGLTPTVKIEATYPDGTTAFYVIHPGISEKFTGVKWKSSDLLPYFDALLFQKVGSNSESLICKILPVACRVPAWVWLAATVYGLKETIDAKGSPMAYVYGGGAFLSFDAFSRAGGFSAVLPAQTD